MAPETENVWGHQKTYSANVQTCVSRHVTNTKMFGCSRESYALLEACTILIWKRFLVAVIVWHLWNCFQCLHQLFHFISMPPNNCKLLKFLVYLKNKFYIFWKLIKLKYRIENLKRQLLLPQTISMWLKYQQKIGKKLSIYSFSGTSEFGKTFQNEQFRARKRFLPFGKGKLVLFP